MNGQPRLEQLSSHYGSNVPTAAYAAAALGLSAMALSQVPGLRAAINGSDARTAIRKLAIIGGEVVAASAAAIGGFRSASAANVARFHIDNGTPNWVIRRSQQSSGTIYDLRTASR